ncbi:MAG: DUF1552 domain-containing protein [Opitutae bacterium]|jgi:hypothetical protein|nr:DUF1552 domain-containing protein [Opitutae bacterium]MBT5692193.1 DUF1552 domain-containing protein [Opitutae bacterium]MBT6462025.1 DUF1552 domain-containing protein [Opitutae bacterium]MBT7853351.1 DUF1552 domain-containing protein [Opitutae bacterium]
MNISRRKFLKTKGAVLTLPILHSLPKAIAAPATGRKPDKKLVIMYVPNGIVRRCFFPGEEEGVLPGFVGGFNADKFKDKKRVQNDPGIYPLDLTSTMQPLVDHTKDISLVTGMDRTFKNGQDVHAQGASCYLTSISPEQATEQKIRYPNGRSLDQVIGDKVGLSTVFKTLEISCNGFTQGKESIYFNNISWYGPDKIAPSIKDPKKLYNRLFMADSYRTHLTDVTDLMLADANALSRKLDREDRDTLGEFMTMIRDVEVRIDKLQKMIAGADIKEPSNEILPRGEYIKLQADLMILALQMGITNICTFMIGPERWEASLRYEGVFDNPVNHHTFTHNQKGDGYKKVQKIDIFHMQQYAYILSRMKAVKEADGSSLLDNSLVTYGAALGDGSTHQYFDLPFIVAGKGQGQIKQGRFIKCKSGTLNSNMWLSIAQLMGLEIDSFADSTGVISDMWT